MTASTPDTAVVRAGEAPGRPVAGVRLLGVLAILGGLLLAVVGVGGWIGVSSQLAAEQIVVPDDAIAFAGATVADPFTAYVQADTIQRHALEESGGLTYAQLEEGDPARATLESASFLRASLFTSVVAFGVSAFAFGVGVLAIILGAAVHRLASAPAAGRAPRRGSSAS